MSESQLSPGFSDYLAKNVTSGLRDDFTDHWNNLLRVRGPQIIEAQKLITPRGITPPFYFCRPNPSMLKDSVDFDFGPCKPSGLPLVLYTAIADLTIAYSEDGQLVIAPPNQKIIPPPFTRKERGHYIIQADQVAQLPADHPAFQLYELTSQVIKSEGLTSAQDIVFLLSVIAGEKAPNKDLLEVVGIPIHNQDNTK